MHKLQWDEVREYTLAGNATITLRSVNTDKRYTFRIKQCDNKEVLYFVDLLRGSDNENDYTYIGCFYSDTEDFIPIAKYRAIDHFNWPKPAQAIRWFFKHLSHIPDTLEVYRSCKCGRCGRKLTTPESIESGYGPECINLVRRKHV